MRPADENQYSTRPNLMSSGRRTSNDQSILEMLERDTGRGSRRRGRSRLRWYGAGSALAVGLIGLLAWLTHDGPPPQEAQPIAVAEVAPPPEKVVRPDPAAELSGLADLDEPPRPHHAAVVDERPSQKNRPITPVAMLAPSSQPALAAASGTGGAVVQDEPAVAQRATIHPAAAANKPVHSDAADGKRSTGTRVTSPAASTPKKQVPAASIDAPRKQPTRGASDTARSRAQGKSAASNVHGAPRKLAQSTPRARKPAASVQPSHPAVDSDVALISAVIQHSATRADSACADAACAAKTTAQP